MTRWKRIAASASIALAVLLVLAAISVVVTINSSWFLNFVRQRIITEVERVSGGQVEIGSFRFDQKTLTATVAPFILHGKEPAGERPLFRADSIQVGLKIISALKHSVDVSSLTVERPQVHLMIAADGTTNLPEPKLRRRSPNNVEEQILDLAVRKLAFHDGYIQYNSQTIPLNAEAEGVNALLTYDRSGMRYGGNLNAGKVKIQTERLGPLAFGLSSSLSLEKNRVQIQSTQINMNESSLEFSGAIQDLSSPHGDFDLEARLVLSELAKPLRLPVERTGETTFRGKAFFRSQPLDYGLLGKVNGRHLAYHSKQLNLNDAALSSDLKVLPHRLELNSLACSALGGTFRGSLVIRDWKDLRVEGEARGFSLHELARAAGEPNVQWDGVASGPVRVESQISRTGFTHARVQTKLDVVPSSSGIPTSGSIDADYDHNAGVLRLGNSKLYTGSTQLDFSGTLGQTLRVTAVTRNLNDILPAFALAGAKTPQPLPVTLKNGSARVDTIVAGPLNNPQISGHLDVTQFVFQDRAFDHLAADFMLDRSHLSAHNLALDRNSLHLEAAGDATLQAWEITDASAVNASFTLKNAPIDLLLAEAQVKAPVTGNLSAKGVIHGSVASPEAEVKVSADHVVAYEEIVDRAQADVQYRDNSLTVSNGVATAGASLVEVSGEYLHSREIWKSGQMKFVVNGSRVSLANLKHVRGLGRNLAGLANVSASGSARVNDGDFELTSMNGDLALRNVAVEGKSMGDFLFKGNTSGTDLTLNLTGDVRQIKIKGGGRWRLEGNYPGSGQLEFSRVTFATLQDIVSQGKPEPLPFEGFIEGSATFTGPLRDVDALRGTLRLSTIQVNPGPELHPRAGAAERDLVLHNSKPVVLEISNKAIDVKSAAFAAKDTSLDVTGKVAIATDASYDLQANGAINLAILQLFNADLLASGTSTVTAVVRGRPSDPSVNGRLELKDASLYLADLPNGIDKANGVVLFDRNRATIEKLTAETGGGRISLGGFVGFSGSVLSYRLQAKADQVRYRSPQGISITMDAALGVSGTSQSSILSGTVTVLRIGFNPRTDIGGLLAEAAKPVSTPATPNEYLRGIQFDVHVEGAQNLQLQTSMTSNVQGEIDLRVRGTPQRPVLLGNVSVNEGQIEFFGNKYTIDRGVVNFYNSNKIEPVIDLDLETRVRAVTVDIVLTGPLNKLNLTYRSDPPLESNQILALLAVGRDPLNNANLASSQIATQSSFLGTGTNALLSQAISAPVSGRLQRFFGVSHIKIDPQLNDLTSVPQARLTLEQQFSKNVTVTFITNLARAGEQIVRVEWDFSKIWSVVALRDENGAFGIDFQYRKRFK